MMYKWTSEVTTEEMEKVVAKEMTRMMAKRTMGAMDKETSRRRKMTTMITVSKTMMRMMDKTHLLMRTWGTSGGNRNMSSHMCERSEKMTKRPILSAWINKTLT